MYTAGVDLGQLIHVLYPLGDLICTTFNSTPSEELSFHLSYCYFAAGAAWDMYRIWRIHISVVANVYSWGRFRATHARLIPAG